MRLEGCIKFLIKQSLDNQISFSHVPHVLHCPLDIYICVIFWCIYIVVAKLKSSAVKQMLSEHDSVTYRVQKCLSLSPQPTTK